MVGRYRDSLTQKRTRKPNGLHDPLKETGVKLSSLATDALSVSGRLTLDTLVSGTTDPDVLAARSGITLSEREPRSGANGCRVASRYGGAGDSLLAASDGVRLAWAKHGKGPPIVKAAN